MTNSEVLIILSEIEKAMYSREFKATLQEKAFILSAGSICRTPQRLSVRQGEWLQAIYRISQGHYAKKWSKYDK